MRKKLMLLLLFSVFVFSCVSAIPYILFVDPTPLDGFKTNSGFIEINSTINNVSSLDELIWGWDGTNYTLYNEDLILMMNFENNAGIGENDTFVRDLSLYENNGSVLNGAKFILDGKYGGAYSFDSDGQSIVLPEDLKFVDENFTVSFWYKPESTNAKIKQVVANSFSSYLLFESGELYVWGANSKGELGTGDTTYRFTLEKVLEDYNFSSLSKTDYPGDYNNEPMCGLLHNGTALCWGYNGFGQLGDNTTTDRLVPTPVYGDYNFSVIYNGRNNNCGLLQNGTLLCWGLNAYGCLGINSTTQKLLPTPVYGDYTFSSITVGDNMACGIQFNGSALCWGRNNGALGDNTTTDRWVPTPVYGDYNFSKIIGGNEKTCGILANGSLLCWGLQDSQGGTGFPGSGGLGTNDDIDYNIPTFVYGDNLTFKDLEASYFGFCGVSTNGSVMCWGHGEHGTNGDGSISNNLAPTFVFGDYTFSSVSVGYAHVLGILENKDIVSWGHYPYYHSDNLRDPLEIVYFPTSPNFDFGDFSFLEQAWDYVCGLLHNGSVMCWGLNDYGQLGDGTILKKELPTPVAGDYNFSLISSGDWHTCGLLQNGSALCWGANWYGHLGTGNLTDMKTPSFVLGEYIFSSLSSGGYHNCGLLYNGSALCWGANWYGNLGTGNLTDMKTPSFVLGGYNFSSLYCGGYHSCGLLQNGSALCWGNNEYGDLGIGNITSMKTPQFVSGGHTFTSLYSKGGDHVCGLLYNGSALCWGLNTNGQLGDNTTTNQLVPTPVYGDYNFSEIKLGRGSTYGLLENGTLFVWGGNSKGELGLGPEITYSNVPTALDLPQGVSKIYIGASKSTFLRLEDGSIVAFGNNMLKRLGVYFKEYDFFSVPSRGIFSGKLFGKNEHYFDISSSIADKGFIKIFLNGNFANIILDEEEYNHIGLTYNGVEAKVYHNGELQSSFEAPPYLYHSELSPLVLGNDSRGEIDEVRVWNRSLSEDEIQQIYVSNLEKVNSTSWEFYSNQNLDEYKTYNYGLFLLDQETSFSLLRSVVREISSGGSGTSTQNKYNYQLNREFYEQGERFEMKKNNYIRFRHGEENHTLTLDRFDSSTAKITIRSDPITVDLNKGISQDFDLNEDENMDIEITYEGVKNGNAQIVVSKLVLVAGESVVTANTEEEEVQESETSQVPTEDLLGPGSADTGTKNKTKNKLQTVLISLIVMGAVIVGLAVIGKQEKKKKEHYLGFFDK